MVAECGALLVAQLIEQSCRRLDNRGDGYTLILQLEQVRATGAWSRISSLFKERLNPHESTDAALEAAEIGRTVGRDSSEGLLEQRPPMEIQCMQPWRVTRRL